MTNETNRFGNTPPYCIDEDMRSKLSAEDYGMVMCLWNYLQSVANWTTTDYPNNSGVILHPCEAICSGTEIWKTKKCKPLGDSLSTVKRRIEPILQILVDYGLVVSMREEFNTCHHKTIIVKLMNINDRLFDEKTKAIVSESDYNKADAAQRRSRELQFKYDLVCEYIGLDKGILLDDLYDIVKHRKYEGEVQETRRVRRYMQPFATLSINTGEEIWPHLNGCTEVDE